jgi:hypothetical protein
MIWRDKSKKFKSGIILILLSIVFFIILAIVPFLNIERGIKITLSTVFFILAEVLFYLGGFLIGKEMFNKYKYWFNPVNWFKKRPAELELEESSNIKE